MSIPYRDGSVDAVVTDPPYYDMIEYADASDLFHVWLKRVLFDIERDLFGPQALRTKDGLQNKNDEIIVRRVQEPGRIRHDKDFYEAALSKAFAECLRVLRPDGHLVVVFGHSDPDAWKRLLAALHDGLRRDELVAEPDRVGQHGCRVDSGYGHHRLPGGLGGP